MSQDNPDKLRYDYSAIKPNGKFATGRPSKYDSDFCEKMLDFFSIEHTREIPEIITFKDGTTKESSKTVPNPLPQFGKFARSIGVTHDTILEWCKVHSEFSETYKECKRLQEEFLIANGLEGNYNATFAIFTAKNITDMRDQTNMVHSGDQDNPILITATLQKLFPVQQIE